MSEYNAFEVDRLPETCGHTAQYFRERSIRLDTRGPLTIHPESRWGYFVTVITKSHHRGPGDDIPDGALVDRPVIVDREAWICSSAILYNCIIGEGAIVAVGAVVRSQEVKPYVMVAGNPARVIARNVAGTWVYDTGEKWEILA